MALRFGFRRFSIALDGKASEKTPSKRKTESENQSQAGEAHTSTQSSQAFYAELCAVVTATRFQRLPVADKAVAVHRLLALVRPDKTVVTRFATRDSQGPEQDDDECTQILSSEADNTESDTVKAFPSPEVREEDATSVQVSSWDRLQCALKLLATVERDLDRLRSATESFIGMSDHGRITAAMSNAIQTQASIHAFLGRNSPAADGITKLHGFDEEDQGARVILPIARRGSVVKGPSVPRNHSCELQAAISNALRNVPILQSLSEQQLAQMNDPRVYAVKEYTKDELIIRQSEVGKTLFLLLEGSATIWKRSEVSASDSVSNMLGHCVRTLQAPSYFGDRALILNGLRTASVRAETKLVCVVIHRDTFEAAIAETTTLQDGFVPDQSEDSQINALHGHIHEFVSNSDLEDGGSGDAAYSKRREVQLEHELFGLDALELDAEDVIEYGMRVLQRILHVEKTSLYVADIATNSLIRHTIGGGPGSPKPLRGIAGFTSTTGGIVNPQEVSSDPRYDPGVDTHADHRTRQLVSVPVYNTRGRHVYGDGDNALGAIQCVNRVGKEAFSDDDVRVIRAVARRVGVALTSRLEKKLLSTSSPSLSQRFSISISRLTVDLASLGSGAHAGIVAFGAYTTLTMKLFQGREELCSEVMVTSSQSIVHEADNTIVFAFQDSLELPDSTPSYLPLATRAIFEVQVFVKQPVKTVSRRRSSIMMLGGASLRTKSVSSMMVMDDVEESRMERPADTARSGVDAVLMGWCGCCVFSPEGSSECGDRSLKVWTNALFDPLAPSTLQNSESGCELQVQVFNCLRDHSDSCLLGPVVPITPLTKAEETTKLHELQTTVLNNPMHQLSTEEREWIWHLRHRLVSDPSSLPWFMLAVRWNDQVAVQEAYQYLYKWDEIEPELAIRLLSPCHADPKVRAYAVYILETKISTGDLSLYMLQLIQALRHERFHDCALSRFLLRRALAAPSTVGHQLYWQLKAEMNRHTGLRHRFGLLLNTFLRFSTRENRLRIGHQVFVMKKLEDIHERVLSVDTMDEKNDLLRTQLQETIFPSEFVLPLDHSKTLCGVIPERCRVLGSKQKPLYLVFRCLDSTTTLHGDAMDREKPEATTFHVLFKSGDDLRQDQLVLQLFRVMNRIWQHASLDMQLISYGCIATGPKCGMIEVVRNSDTVGNIFSHRAEQQHGSQRGTTQHKIHSALGVLTEQKALQEWLLLHSLPSSHDHQQTFQRLHRASMSGKSISSSSLDLASAMSPARDKNSLRLTYGQVVRNFAQSCAASCVASYVLGIGDRHNDNIMLSRQGHLFHIDFGHILGNFKKKFGVKRERALFVFTPAFASVLMSDTTSNDEKKTDSEDAVKKEHTFLKHLKHTGHSKSCHALCSPNSKPSSQPQDEQLPVASVVSQRQRWQNSIHASLRFTIQSTEPTEPSVRVAKRADPTVVPAYALFTNLCGDGYNAVRHQAGLLFDLCALMTHGGIPELQCEDDLQWLQTHLLLAESDEAARKHFLRLLKHSLASRSTLLNDAAHMLKHG